jgi:hypothetical protein
MSILITLLVFAVGLTAGCVITHTIIQPQPTECPNCAVADTQFQALIEISATTQQAHDQMMRAAQATAAHHYQAAHRAAPRFYGER